MKVGVIAAAAAVVLFAASGASAHPGSWYWTRAATEDYVFNNVSTSDDENIVDVSCSGMGSPGRRAGRVLWHHMRCDENDDLDREFTIVVHPTSRYHAVVIEIACDDSYSDYACP